MSNPTNVNEELQEEFNKYQRENFLMVHKTKKNVDDDADDKLKRKENEIDFSDDDFEGEERKEDFGHVEFENYEPFNLDNERDEGKFDNEGNYIKFKREEEEKDGWIEMIENEKKGEIKEKEIQQIKQKEIERFLKEEERCQKVENNKNEIYLKIINILQPKETSKKAICRLKKEKKIEQMNELIDACGNLVDIGEYLIYEKTKEQVQQLIH